MKLSVLVKRENNNEINQNEAEHYSFFGTVQCQLIIIMTGYEHTFLSLIVLNLFAIFQNAVEFFFFITVCA